MKILIMGLPGSGKTTLSAQLAAHLLLKHKFTWLNADTIRKRYNDWDFSDEGRLRQAYRMRDLADKEVTEGRICICDFVAPTEEIRNIFNADIVIWLDTIKESRFEDTNKLFIEPTKYDYRITEQNAEKWAKEICSFILESMNDVVL